MDYSCILYESLAKIKTKSNIPIPSFGRKKKLKELMLCLVSKLTFILSLVVLTEGCQYYIWAAPGLVSVCLRRVTHWIIRTPEKMKTLLRRRIKSRDKCPKFSGSGSLIIPGIIFCFLWEELSLFSTLCQGLWWERCLEKCLFQEVIIGGGFLIHVIMTRHLLHAMSTLGVPGQAAEAGQGQGGQTWPQLTLFSHHPQQRLYPGLTWDQF